MIDINALGIGLGLALLGGLTVALAGRRWGLCPLEHCPALEAGMRLELLYEGKPYVTLLAGVDGDTLFIIPPLQRGLPVSFPTGAFAQLRLKTPAGVFETTLQFVGRQTKPQPMLLVRVVHRWRRTQRRRHERLPLPDEVNVVIQRHHERWIGWARDVSSGGMRLIAPAPAAVHEQVRLELPTALRGLAGSASERTARVVACERAPTRNGYAYQLRLAFIDDGSS
ncbi:MAG: hypothetical protein CFK49_02355 [Armatimonadetes bacterium JP3_11]|nr:MAG: hypothetical protein CFK48_06955 [Armatimonadetes bacterium CP1_7O]OYT75575.1 MAG: hypothetical protein CFK49_02355 [Armatimonadetes bacterium JP3_11]RMH06293.1 MAG: PilZ domain-containing protein [Armatimonadota bacterium]